MRPEEGRAPETELQTDVSLHVGARNKNMGPLQEHLIVNPEMSLQSLTIFLNIHFITSYDKYFTQFTQHFLALAFPLL